MQEIEAEWNKRSDEEVSVFTEITNLEAQVETFNNDLQKLIQK